VRCGHGEQLGRDARAGERLGEGARASSSASGHGEGVRWATQTRLDARRRGRSVLLAGLHSAGCNQHNTHNTPLFTWPNAHQTDEKKKKKINTYPE